MIKNKDVFIAFVDSLPIADSSKRTCKGWVNRIEKNHPNEISCRTVQSEEDVRRLAKSMPRKSYVAGHFKDVLCIVRYYLKFCLDEDVKVQQDLAETEGAFSPTSTLEARTKVTRSIALRRGQQKFRHQLMAAYGQKCCVTGTEMSDVLEAAHIRPYAHKGTNSVNNGLLLRADIHVLL